MRGRSARRRNVRSLLSQLLVGEKAADGEENIAEVGRPPQTGEEEEDEEEDKEEEKEEEEEKVEREADGRHIHPPPSPVRGACCRCRRRWRQGPTRGGRRRRRCRRHSHRRHRA